MAIPRCNFNTDGALFSGIRKEEGFKRTKLKYEKKEAVSCHYIAKFKKSRIKICDESGRIESRI